MTSSGKCIRYEPPQWTKHQQKTATWTVEVEPWASPKCKQSDTVEIISSFKCSLKRIIRKTSRGKCSIFLLISAQSYSKRIKSAEISQCLVQLSLNEHYLLFFSAVYLCVMQSNGFFSNGKFTMYSFHFYGTFNFTFLLDSFRFVTFRSVCVCVFLICSCAYGTRLHNSPDNQRINA